MQILKFALLISSILYILFETEAFVEYARLFKLRFLKYQEYDQQKKVMPAVDYSTFLLMNYNSFYVRLLTCPICLGVWLTGLTILGFNLDFDDFGLVFISSIIVYYLTRSMGKLDEYFIG
jgi:hypothetical protein